MTPKISLRAALNRTLTSLAAIAAVCVIFAAKAVELSQTAGPTQIAGAPVIQKLND